LHTLNLKDGDVVVDATAGAGGHSRAMESAAKIHLIALDADASSGAGAIEANFGDLEQVLAKLRVKKINKALFDLGWNRGQLEAGRGFSFMRDEPLDMRYGKKARSGFTAAEIVNTWSEATLADVLFGYGEERYARRIAKAVVLRRRQEPIETTRQLVELIRASVPAAYTRGRLHPATKTFQALRIAVNDELGVLESGLEAAWKHLACHGHIAVITFHSIEDRLVKRIFARFKKEGGMLLSKKPLVPNREEIINNPSARSAKLRGIEKICTQ
jgi:16S rRNA (cytosine1402-N4)-methyltransferase